jgi:hypothetical protein
MPPTVSAVEHASFRHIEAARLALRDPALAGRKFELLGRFE